MQQLILPFDEDTVGQHMESLIVRADVSGWWKVFSDALDNVQGLTQLLMGSASLMSHVHDEFIFTVPIKPPSWVQLELDFLGLHVDSIGWHVIKSRVIKWPSDFNIDGFTRIHDKWPTFLDD